MFKLTQFSPVGFEEKKYPNKFCSICRGLLNDVCSMCIEKKNDVCQVIFKDDTYYHGHCHEFINKP